MLSYITGVTVDAICACLPAKKISVAEHCSNIMTEKEAKRVSRSTGFWALRLAAVHEKTSDMCAKAVNALFAADAALKEQIDGIIFVSQTPDYILPATSHILQDRLRLRNDIIALDINQGCSGYVYGLNIAAALIASKQCRKVLVCVGDTGKGIDPKDQATKPIFGDGAAATIVRADEDSSGIFFNIDTFGAQHQAIIVKPENNNYLYLNGLDVMNFALDCVPANVDRVLEFASQSKHELGFKCFFHQANQLILISLAEKLRLAPEQVPFLAAYIGNTSSASIPLALTEGFAGEHSLSKTLLCGFGVGLSVASAVLDLSKTKILTTVEL